MARLLELNYCPRCGHSLEDRKAYGRVRRGCPSCELVIFRDHKVASGVLIERDGQVLLVRRAMTSGKGKWVLPAGFVDFDEDPARTAVRECREETGLDIEISSVLDVMSGKDHVRGADIAILYRGQVVGGELAAADDVGEAAFFSPEELPPLAFRATRVALNLWRASLLRR